MPARTYPNGPRRDINAEDRAERAARLLATTRLTYAEIAAAVGYHSRQACHKAIWAWHKRQVAERKTDALLRADQGLAADELRRELWMLVGPDADGRRPEALDLDAARLYLATMAYQGKLEGLIKQVDKTEQAQPVTRTYVGEDVEPADMPPASAEGVSG